MHRFIIFLKEFQIPKKNEILKTIKSFTKKELSLFFLILSVSLISLIVILVKINKHFLVEVPSSGGTITEGIIGTPVLINPILAISDADKDLTSIVYSGLMRRNEYGEYIPDLASSYEISEDGKTYTFYLKENLKFHDGEKLDADDIIFTIEKIKDPLIKSPRKSNWDGVEVSKVDDMTISFKLSEPYISFMDNTTIGILPEHLWKNVGTQEFSLSNLNMRAIGTGPYKIVSVSKNKDGVPEMYKLKYFKNFSLKIPHIKYFIIKTYSNEKDLIKALESGDIDQAGGISPKNIDASQYKINTATLSRNFSLFLNENKNKNFSDPNVILAIDKAINKQKIIDDVLNGYGTPINNPVPEYLTKNEIPYENNYDPEESIKLLNKSGWHLNENGVMEKGGTEIVEKTKKVGKKTVTEKVKVDNGPVVELSFSITTGDTPELRATVASIQESLLKIGIKVDINKIYETGQLSQTIRNREYEALFFGQIISHESDLYSYWHSSQRGDPGLNIAMANSKNYDLLLENIQKILSLETRIPEYKKFAEEFEKNPKAVVIYSPTYIYISSKNINNKLINTLNNPSDRFNLIYEWYAKKDLVWKIFTK